MALQAKRGMFRLLSRKQQEEYTDKYIEMLQIKTASRETPIKSLSGGNQQKVIIGRWLLTNPDFLILDEPTRGIDVGTKTEIQKLVVKLAEEGMAVVFPSCFRRVLTLEQYRDPRMANLYQRYLAKGPVSYMEPIFEQLTKDSQKARQLVLDFYGPIFLLYSIYDGAEEKESVVDKSGSMSTK